MKAVSVIIPAFNEEQRILPTIINIGAYLESRFEEFEIIVVDDGSKDRTSALIEERSSELKHTRLLRSPANKGKGHSVKEGILSSQAALCLISDADLSTPVEEMEKLEKAIHEGADIAIGSRGLRESDIAVRQPWYREIMGKSFNLLVRALLMKNIRDTQCGFKLLRGDVARKIFEKSRVTGFSFDVEILLIGREMGFKIQEVPVKWMNSTASKVSLLRDPLMMFFDLVRIRFYLLMGRYKT